MTNPAEQSRQRGILRLKHHREQHEARAEEMAEMSPRFERLAQATAAPRVVTSFNLFQTPPHIAAQMAGLFADHPAPASGPLNWLEPSAGLGRLYTAARTWTATNEPHHQHDFTLVDVSRDLCEELYRMTEPPHQPAHLICGDFMAQDPQKLGQFHRIVMNPPFKNGTDIKHIQHARKFLAPGGRIVALCAAGPRQHRDLYPIATTWQILPARSFRSEGTAVDVVLLTIDG